MGNSTNSFRLSGFRWLGICSHRQIHVGELARIKPIELKSHSKSPVSQGVARSGTAEWHPYRSSIRINATNAETRISWQLPLSTTKEREHILGLFIRELPNPILHLRSLRPSLGGTFGPSLFGDLR
jgi:hypothetical protein